MRIHGYCIKCRKIKRVNVSNSSLERSIATNSVTMGVCDDCDDMALFQKKRQ